MKQMRDDRGFLNTDVLNKQLAAVDQTLRHEMLGKLMIEAFGDCGYSDPLDLAVFVIDLIERHGLDALRDPNHRKNDAA